MSAVYEEPRPKERSNERSTVHSNKLSLSRREISSLEVRNKWTGDCILNVYMASGKKYGMVGNCQDLEEIYDEIRDDMQCKFPGTYSFQ